MNAKELVGKTIVGERFSQATPSDKPCYIAIMEVVSCDELPTSIQRIYDSFRKEKFAIAERYDLESKKMIFDYDPYIARQIMDGLESGELKEIDLGAAVTEGMKIERVLHKRRTGPDYSASEDTLKNLIRTVTSLPVGQSVYTNLSYDGSRTFLKRLEQFGLIRHGDYVLSERLGQHMFVHKRQAKKHNT
jgi:hypothetical protein